MNIEHSRTPNPSDIDFLTQQINQETSDFGFAYPFSFFMRDGAGTIIAGCNGSVLFGCMYTDQLWVNKNYRRQGLGRQLMEAVHRYGREAGCRIATVNTMSFQGAQSFYERLGYVVDFQRPGYAHNTSCIFLKRSL